MIRQAAAFAPGHITGFFAVHDEATDPVAIGSRGAGFSVEKGVTSRVRLDDESTRHGIVVRIDGAMAPAETTRRAVQILLGPTSAEVEVAQEVGLPISQGFGMSAAGALSATLALASCLKRPREEAVRAAHLAEVFQRTGLGDVVGSAVGGFEVRLGAGLPPAGRIESWNPMRDASRVHLGALGDPILTKRVLTDPKRRDRINDIGDRLVDEFVGDRSLEKFLELSRRFALETDLASAPIRTFLETPEGRTGGQCMLGGSVFVFGGPPANERARWIETRVAHDGAGTLRT